MGTDMTKMTEVDIAYKILEKEGHALYFKDLIMQVIEQKHKPVQSLSLAISEVYTQMNMDSRFQHMGKGMWGLAELAPQEVKRSHSAVSASKTNTKRRERLLEEIQDLEAVVPKREAEE